MKKKVTFSGVICIVVSISLVYSSVFAATKTWSYSNYANGSYVPKSGTMETLFYSNFITTQTSFTLDSTNVTSIHDYNNGGDNPGTACDNKEGYLNLDMTAIPDNSWDLEVDAYAQSTTLPDPKFDLETDGGVDNQESDVTALGSVSASSYWAQTNWHDNRDGDANDSGKFQAQFDISAKGFSDYNPCVISGAVQAIQLYGDDLGQP